MKTGVEPRRLAATLSRIVHSPLSGRWLLNIALLLVLACAVSVYVSIRELRGAFGWVQHTDAVVLQIATVETSVLSADSATRARVFQGVRPGGQDAPAALAAQVRRLGALVSDNPLQAEHIRVLTNLVAMTPGSVPRGEGAEFDRLAKIRAQLIGMQTVESRLMLQRTETARQATQVALRIAIGSGVLAVLLGLFGQMLVSRARGRRLLAELELMHSQRLNIMGETTIGLAQEMNDPLAAARDYIAMFQNRAKALDLVPLELLDIVSRAARQIERADTIIQRLRAFVERRDGMRYAEEPRTIIQDAVALSDLADGADKMMVRVADNLPTVIVDRIEIQQVLLNLIRNALQATAGREGCRIVISAFADHSDGVCFSVRDNGPGLSQRAIQTLFKPFIAAKKTGAGLAICRTIVTAHGGRIWAENAPDGGADFKFLLPVVALRAAA